MDTYKNESGKSSKKSWADITEEEANPRFRLDFKALAILEKNANSIIVSQFTINPVNLKIDELINLINTHALQGEYLPLTVLVDTLFKHSASKPYYIPVTNIKYLYFLIKSYAQKFGNNFIENDFKLLLEANRAMIACYREHTHFYKNKIVNQFKSHKSKKHTVTREDEVYFKRKAKEVIEKEAKQILKESLNILQQQSNLHSSVALIAVELIQLYISLGFYRSATELIEKYTTEFYFEPCEDYYKVNIELLYQVTAANKSKLFSPTEFLDTVIKYYDENKNHINFNSRALKEILHWSAVYIKTFSSTQNIKNYSIYFLDIIEKIEEVYKRISPNKITDKEQEKLLEIFIFSQQFNKALELTETFTKNTEKLSAKLYELMITAYFFSAENDKAYHLLETAFTQGFFKKNLCQTDPAKNIIKLDPRDHKIIEEIGKIDYQSQAFLSLLIHHCLQKAYENLKQELETPEKYSSHSAIINLTYNSIKFNRLTHLTKVEIAGENTRRTQNSDIVKQCIYSILTSHYRIEKIKIKDNPISLRSTLTVTLDDKDLESIHKIKHICNFKQMHEFTSNAEKLVKKSKVTNNRSHFYNHSNVYNTKLPGEPRHNKHSNSPFWEKKDWQNSKNIKSNHNNQPNKQVVVSPYQAPRS